tara:strand:- start:177 stop:311 length:135 start_codon:yes stop_codon:yes gene_type:complete
MDAEWLYKFNTIMIIVETFSALDFMTNFFLEFTENEGKLIVRGL